jgi:hypothetical protein
VAPPRRLFVKTGQRFGRGIIMREDRVAGVRMAFLTCDCGKLYRAALKELFSGHTKSCGCHRTDIVIARNHGAVHPARTHGHSKHPNADRWRQVMRRCEDPSSPDWEHYGGRGITLWGPWHDLVRFCDDLDELLGECPPGMSLDRADNERGYEPDNVRWADASTQNRNRRTNGHLGRTCPPDCSCGRHRRHDLSIAR